MKRFSYERPESLDEALRVLAESGPEVELLAGGTGAWWEATGPFRETERYIREIQVCQTVKTGVRVGTDCCDQLQMDRTGCHRGRCVFNSFRFQADLVARNSITDLA